MKKLISLLAVVAIVICLFAGVSVMADTSKTLVNGDAELGTTEGFSALFGNGTVTNVADPKDATNKVIYYQPVDNNTYSSLLYDVGPAIVQDSANGYNGGGAGKYYLEFKVLGDDASKGDMYFRPSLVAANWSGFNVSVVGSPNKYVIIKGADWTKYTFEFNITATDIAKLTKAEDYVIGTRIDGSSGCAYEQGNYIGYYVDDVVFYKEGNEPTPKPVVSATPVAEKELVNGDAELGTTESFSALFGNGTVTNVADPKDATNKVIYYQPAENNAYSSLLYDVGPAIVQDSANGYNGGGAGKYYLEFKVLGDDASKGDMYFRPSLVAANWSGFDVSVVGSPNKYVIIKGADWTKYTFEFNITATDIAKLTKAEDYVIGTRIDGSNGCAYAQGNYIGYYVDNVVFYKEGNTPAASPSATATTTTTATATATATATVTPAPQANKFVNGDAESGTDNWSSLFGDKGTVENVTVDGSKVIHFIPKSGDVYSSVFFDVGAYIIKDDSMKATKNWFDGWGAGEYTLSFRIKADTADAEGRFYLGLESGAWRNNITVKPHELNVTDEWIDVEVEFTVTQEYLDTLKGLYLTDSKAYQIGIRLDGSQAECAYGKGNYFGYYIDDVVILHANDTSIKNDGSVDTGDINLIPVYAIMAVTTIAFTAFVIRKKEN